MFFFFYFEPDSTIVLPENFISFDVTEKYIYLVQFNGREIISLDIKGNISKFPIEGKLNERIYTFKLTPFFIYFSGLDGIFRLSIQNGMIESVFNGDIGSFIITDAEELIIADRRRKEILFLNLRHKIRLRLKNINIIDMAYYKHQIYLLTRKGIIILDEYGNTIKRIAIPERQDKIIVDKSIWLFTPYQKIVYKWDENWKMIELNRPILDLKIYGERVLTLNQYGDTLFIYDRSDF